MEFTTPEDGICTVCHEEAKLFPMAWNEPPTRCYSCFVEQVALWEAGQEMKDEPEFFLIASRSSLLKKGEEGT